VKKLHFAVYSCLTYSIEKQLTLFPTVSRRGLLRSPYPESCIPRSYAGGEIVNCPARVPQGTNKMWECFAPARSRSRTFVAVAFVVECHLAPIRQEQRHLHNRAHRRRQQTLLVSSPDTAEVKRRRPNAERHRPV
jgi:hypothetical protein